MMDAFDYAMTPWYSVFYYKGLNSNYFNFKGKPKILRTQEGNQLGGFNY